MYSSFNTQLPNNFVLGTILCLFLLKVLVITYNQVQ